MDAFWTFAKRMMRYRATLVVALVCAFVSAGGLGIGLVGLTPVLENILGEGKELSEMFVSVNQTLSERVGVTLPASWGEALPQGQFNAVLWIIILLGGLAVVGGLANFLHAYLSLTVVHRTVTNIRREVFYCVVRAPLKDIVSCGASDTISRVINDTTMLSAGFNALISKAAAQLFKGLASFLAAFIINWKLALAASLVAPVMYMIVRKLGKQIRRASKKAMESQAGLYGAASEALQGLRVVKVHTTERYEVGRFHRINKEVMKQNLRVRTARALASPLVEVLSLFVLGGLSMIAAKAIIDGKLMPGDFIATLMALGAAGASLKPLTGLVNDIQSSAPSADRLMELLNRETETGHDSRLPKLPRHSESVAFDRVTFTYPDARSPALDGVSLNVKHGKSVAIVGANGSGKTTLLALVPRLFEPDHGFGRVLIDGHDICDFSLRSLRRQIGVVTQETIIFQGTIRSNIAYGAENATDARIVEASKMARAHDFVRDLPKGYDTPVGEQGLTLSGGQRQRLAIARAVLRNPAILILDEATSMIDADSEAKIAEAITEFSKGRTCLIVAHRLSTVRSADSIVVMDKGRVVDQGSHDELIERCKSYQLIAKNQLFQGSFGSKGESA